LLFLCVGLFCYVTTVSWDYRLVYILLPAARLSLMANNRLMYLLVVGSSVFTQYHFEQADMLSMWALQLLGDAFLFFLSALLLAEVLRLLRKLRIDCLDSRK
jgi:hypothetical protein